MAPKILTKPEEAEAETQQVKETCTHHWLIDPPDGPVSKGVCKKCGAEKDFKNYIFYSPWESESSPLAGINIEPISDE